jgi:pyruvate/2-oxoglutarate dehydrogenase complex dihydrolipoamide acyltransferase (E2) component
MRKTIADNLTRSLQESAQLTIVSETDMTEMAAYRDEWLERNPGTRITYVDMLVKVLTAALLEFPVLNASLVGDEILCWKDVNIGIAVALDDGLVVPVVRKAHRKGLEEISHEVKDLATRARAGELKPEDYQGGTFTLTSGGRVETDIITPIINPPESAILAVGKIAPGPAVKDGALVVRTMTHLCLTHDHRIVDGVPASLFLGRVKEIIEDRAQLRGMLKG